MEGVQRCIREERFNTGRAVDGTWYAKQSDYPLATIRGSMIEDDVLIEQASIESSTLLAHTKVGLNAQISNSLVGRSATIGCDVILDGVVVDHDSTIPDGTVQEGYVRSDGPLGSRRRGGGG